MKVAEAIAEIEAQYKRLLGRDRQEELLTDLYVGEALARIRLRSPGRRPSWELVQNVFKEMESWLKKVAAGVESPEPVTNHALRAGPLRVREAYGLVDPRLLDIRRRVKEGQSLGIPAMFVLKKADLDVMAETMMDEMACVALGIDYHYVHQAMANV